MGPTMSHFSVREVLLVLALAAVSINWAWDHWSQVKWREELRRNVAAEQSRDQKVQSLDVNVEQQKKG